MYSTLAGRSAAPPPKHTSRLKACAVSKSSTPTQSVCDACGLGNVSCTDARMSTFPSDRLGGGPCVAAPRGIAQPLEQSDFDPACVVPIERVGFSCTVGAVLLRFAAGCTPPEPRLARDAPDATEDLANI